jgi:N-acetylmuramate 1-kinase
MEASSFPPVQQRLMEFIRHQFQPGYNHYNVRKLLGDASARQYFRYVSEPSDSYILAAYPEPFDPACFPFKQVHDLFLEIELPIPKILALDGQLGIVLQEDLGDDTLHRHLLETTASDKMKLIQRAIDHIVTIQLKGTARLRPEWEAARLAFDEEKLTFELRFFRRHYMGAYRNLEWDEERLMTEFVRLASELSLRPRFLCHRDYHIRNLMLRNGEVHIIDFQDARWGPASYDLASLLKDSLELDEGEPDALIAYYLSRMADVIPSAEKEAFRREFHLMAIQRLLKALGTYGYQITARGNFIYEQYIAGSLHRLIDSLQVIPEFPYIRSVVEKELSGRTEQERAR